MIARRKLLASAIAVAVSRQWRRLPVQPKKPTRH